MINSQARQMDAVFGALADATRRGMIARLSRGPATIGELGQPYAISKPAVTQHIKILERAGLLRRRRDGRLHRCTLKSRHLKEAEAWIEHHRHFWEASLDALASYLDDPTSRGDQV